MEVDYQKRKELIIKQIGTKKSKNIMENQKRKNIDNQDIKNIEDFNFQINEHIENLKE